MAIAKKNTRPLNDNEESIINKDLEELFEFCSLYGLYGSIFKERLKGLTFEISYLLKEKELGNANHFKKIIYLQEEAFKDDYTRKTVLYHEIAHLVFDLDVMPSDIKTGVKDQIVYLNKKYNNPNNGGTCLVGLRLIKEYINEKFSILATNKIMGQKIKHEEKSIMAFGKEYKFNTSFDSYYGIIEKELDNLFLKKYSKLYNIFIDCLNNTLYVKLINEYDSDYLTKSLCEMGQIYNKLYAFIHSERNSYLDESITTNLDNLEEYVSKLSLKENTKEHTIRR